MKKKILKELERLDAYTMESAVSIDHLHGVFGRNSDKKKLAKNVMHLSESGFLKFNPYADGDILIFTDFTSLDKYKKLRQTQMFSFLDRWFTRIIAIAALIVSAIALYKK